MMKSELRESVTAGIANSGVDLSREDVQLLIDTVVNEVSNDYDFYDDECDEEEEEE